MHGPCREKGVHKTGIFGSVKTFTERLAELERDRERQRERQTEKLQS